MRRTSDEIFKEMSHADMNSIEQSMRNEIDKHIINRIMSIGDISTVNSMVDTYRKSYEENINFNNDTAAKALGNLVILMGRKIKMDHCE